MDDRPFTLRPDTRDVLIDGVPVTLGARAFDVLAYLDAHSDRVVSKHELLEQVWGGLVVEEGNLTVQISTLRKTLGARAIATVPGVGYKLAGGAPVAPASGPALPDKPSLAVLPFANLTGDGANDYLVDGIVTDLISSLSRISGIFVIAATSSFALKGQVVQLKDVGTSLGVRYVLEGSIQKAAGIFRIAVQLVEAETSRTIWSERFTGPEADIFELQDKITEDVTGALEPTLLSAEATRAKHKPTESLRAYDLCLQAMTHIQRIPFEDRFRAANALLDRAIALDPDYTLAKAWKCRAYLLARGGRFISMEEFQTISPLAKSLLTSADNDPLVLAFAAIADAYTADNKLDAARAARAAVAISPNSGLVLQCAGWTVSYVEGYAEAADYFERAIRFDPLGHSAGYCRTGLGLCQFFLGDYDAALVTLEQAYSETPDYVSTLLSLMTCYWQLDRRDEARVLAAKVRAAVPGITVTEFLRVTPYQTPAQQALIRQVNTEVGFPP